MQYAKITIIAALSLALLFLSSCSTTNIHEKTTLDRQAELLSQLTLYNDNLTSFVSPKTKSPNWKKIAKISMADISGAGTGAKYGGKLRGKIGAFLGSPIYGAATGALVGGVALGAFCSYVEYDNAVGSIQRTPSDFESIYNRTIEVAALMLSEKAMTNSVYVENNTLIPSYQVDFPKQYEEIELIGVGHNLALEAAIEQSAQVQDLTAGWALSDLETEILSSQELKSALSNIYWGIENDNDIESASASVIDLFLEAYAIISEEDVLNVANDYVDIISVSQALSIEEERAVYSALSVAVNTTYYWSQRLR